MKKELRIGNYFQWSELASMGRGVDQITHGQQISDYADFKESIPLTEEWLKKFGCTKYENVQCLYLTSHALSWTRIELDYDGHYNVFLRQKDEYGHEDFILLPTEIEYVHQLQNLYFALTGEELTLTDKPQGLSAQE